MLDRATDEKQLQGVSMPISDHDMVRARACVAGAGGSAYRLDVHLEINRMCRGGSDR